MLLLFLLGCAPSSLTADALSPEESAELPELAAVFAELQPASRLALLYDFDPSELGDGNCPAYEREGSRERWLGGCRTADGLPVSGVLERELDGEGGWIAGESFVVGPDEAPLFAFDGSIEATAVGEVLLLESACTTCGGPGQPCGPEPVPAVDLVGTLYPRADERRYEVTTSGLVSLGEPALVDGSFRVDLDLCSLEPAEGNLLVELEHPHFLGFDGALACDACALQAVDGESPRRACAEWLP